MAARQEILERLSWDFDCHGKLKLRSLSGEKIEESIQKNEIDIGSSQKNNINFVSDHWHFIEQKAHQSLSWSLIPSPQIRKNRNYHAYLVPKGFNESHFFSTIELNSEKKTGFKD